MNTRRVGLWLFLLLPFSAGLAQEGKPKGAVARTPGKAAVPDSPKVGGEATSEGPKPLPPGQTRVFEAIVIAVDGTAQARNEATADGEGSGKGKWAELKVNDVLKPGTVVRTGPKAEVALRVGVNATFVIYRQSRVAIPEIIQDGEVLRTRVNLNFGKADVKVDRIGLVNDFEVATPTATLAVRGTAFRIWWDVVDGFRSMGVPHNKINAILVKYLNLVEAALSGADSSSEDFKLPALDAFYATYILPLKGAVDEGGGGDGQFPDEGQTDPISDTGLDTGNADRGTKRFDEGNNPPPPGGQSQQQGGKPK